MKHTHIGSFVEPLESRRLLSFTATASDDPPPATLADATADPVTAVSRQVSVDLRAFPGDIATGSNFYARVTADAGTPKGLVYFYAEGQPIGAGWVVDGEAWMHTDHLPVGTHTIYAVYAGDTLHDRASSNAIEHVVLPASRPLAKAVFGRWDWRGNGPTRVIGLYAPGNPLAATGTLTFHNRPTAAASTWSVTATLDALGRADFGVIDPPDDLQFLYYTYSGDTNYPAESSLVYIPAPYTPTAPAPTRISLSADRSATSPGQPITFTAVLQRPSGQTLSAAYGGTVQFWHEQMFLGSAVVDPSGVARLTVHGTETGGNHVITVEGLHQVRAVYSGDATHAPAQAQIWHGVIPSATLTRTVLTADRTTARRDQVITFTATVTDVFDRPVGGQIGWVRLLDEWGKDIAAPVRVGADGTATFLFHSLPADTYEIKAIYTGTLNEGGYTPSRSAPIDLLITRGVTTLEPEISARIVSTTTERYPAELVVSLTKPGAPVPTGRIAIYSQYDGMLLLGYADLDAAGAATTAFQPGFSRFYQKLRIVYLGDANYAPTEETFALTPTYRYLDDRQPAGLPASAAFVCAADVDGDGVRDLIYRDRLDGGVIVRLMDAAGQQIGLRELPAAPVANWALDAAGDIDGDGDADLIWRNLATSRAYIWFLGNGGRLQSQGYVESGGTAPGWRIVGAGDFNRDARADLVWSNDLTGQRAVWLMNGRFVRGFTMFNHAPRDTAWIIESIEDLDGDGDVDLLWRNTRTGGSYGWLLTGTAVTGTTYHK